MPARISVEMKQLIVAELLEGLSVNAVAQRHGVHRDTVTRLSELPYWALRRELDTGPRFSREGRLAEERASKARAASLASGKLFGSVRGSEPTLALDPDHVEGYLECRKMLRIPDNCDLS